MTYILNAYALAILLKFFHAFFWGSVLAGCGILAIAKQKKDEKSGAVSRFLLLLSMPAILLIGAVVAVVVISKIEFDVTVTPSIHDLVGFTLFLAMGIWASVFFLRDGVQAMDKLKGRLTKTTEQERNKKTDIREIYKFLPREKSRFDPLKHVDFGRGIFVGLSENEMPIYLKNGDWETSHIMLTGRTRSGKGVATQVLGTQSIRLGELFVVLDPKVDKWMPHIFKKACDEASQPYRFVDLRQNAGPQINLFDGCDAETIENMLIGAFSLAEKGDNADFYRLGDRKAARQAARYIAQNPGATPRQVLAEFGGEWAESAAGFAAALEEMAELPAVNAPAGTGLSIEAMAQSGGCLYVVGDMQNTRIIRMQRMILMRLMMLAKNRDTLGSKPRTIRVLADEFRVHISRPFIVSLGAAAGWRMLTILAFQSFGDLRDCPADLDVELVEKASIENCAVSLSYRIKDAETAEKLAAQTGQIQVDDETRTVDRNVALSETVLNRRAIRQAERYLVDVNMITSLPVPDEDKETIGCGILVGASATAQFCFTSPVIASRSAAAITPTVVETTCDLTQSVAAEALDVSRTEQTPPVADGQSDESDPTADPFGL